MARIFSDADGKLLGTYFADSPVKDAPAPEGTAFELTLDEASNSRAVALLTAQGDRDEFRLTADGLTWQGIPVPLKGPTAATLERAALEESVAKLMVGRGLTEADWIRLLQAMAVRLGLAQPAVADTLLEGRDAQAVTVATRAVTVS